MAKKKTKTYAKGIGLDIGTMNLVSARSGPKKVSTRTMRDIFLDLPRDLRKRLKGKAKLRARVKGKTSFAWKHRG